MSYQSYIDGVTDGSVPACDLIKRAVERHVQDRHRAAIGDASFPYYFDESAGQLVIDFCGLLYPSKGEWANKPLMLLPWQEFLIMELFGWKRREDDTRRYSIGYIEIPRKNGKSTLLAAIGLYMLYADGEPGAEVYSAATKLDQAKQIWDEAAAMVQSGPLRKHIKSGVSVLSVPSEHAKFKALAADAKTMDGLNTHCGLLDELHEHPDGKVYEKLKTSTGSRRQALILTITTAGVGRESFCYKQRLTAERILKGDAVNDTFFVFIAAIDDKTKWEDEAEWFKCNPSLGHALKIKVLRDEKQLAKDNPDELNNFLRYHLNIWTESTHIWMPMDKEKGWMQPENVGSYLEFPDALVLRESLLEQMIGRLCCAGVDLAATIDITACVLVFPPERLPDDFVGPRPIHDGKWVVIPYFWIPEENVEVRSRRDHVNYDVWVRERFVETTPGNACDSSPVLRKLKALGEKYEIREVPFDRWGAQDFSNDLQAEGFTATKFGQGFQSMSAPMKELLKLILRGQIVHGANPVLRWMASNVVVQQDPTGAIKPDKDKSAEKIDGIVALAMGLARALEYKNVATPEFFTL